MRSNQHKSSVALFFNEHAQDYHQKYDKSNSFYEYFFYERLECATAGLDFTNGRILDVGSGTGALYDYLMQKGLKVDQFIATDISKGMLDVSKVPKEDKKVGDILDIELGTEKFDFIFMLGVSTYINPAILAKQLEKLAGYLHINGRLIITYTNKRSIDIGLRKILLPMGKLVASRKTILAQRFETWYYDTHSFRELISDNLDVEKRIGLNHTFFPVSRVFPKLSVTIAKWIANWSETNLKHSLSSDILVVLSVKEKGRNER